jgi:hypothetical protein
LTQLANPGAPVCYGTFTSNVDMKSGAPAFGTPEHFTAYGPETSDTCRKIAQAPDGIRGYGPVRMVAAQKVRSETDPLLASL